MTTRLGLWLEVSVPLLGCLVVACTEGGAAQAAREARATASDPDPCALLDHTTTLLGPVEVRRAKGKPKQESFSFAAPAAGPACLVVVNGASAPPRGGQVSAAWLELDGQLVVGPEAFSQQVSGFSRPFDFEAGAHQLGVRLASGPESFLTLELRFLGPDETPPTLTFEPAEGDLLTTDLPRLRVGYQDPGRGVDLGTLSVTLNGQVVTGRFVAGPDEAVWQMSIADYLPEGPNTLQARVADRAGNVAEGGVTFEVRVATDVLLAELESEDALYRRRSAAKLIEREGEISTEVLRRSLRQLRETPEPRAVEGLLALARPERGDFLARSLAVAALGETARADPVTSARTDVVAGLGTLLHEDRAPGVKALSARALGLTQNPDALVPLDEVLEQGPRVPARPASCEGFYRSLCDEQVASAVLAAFPAVKAAIRIAGHGHVVGNPGDIMVLWKKYLDRAEGLLGGGGLPGSAGGGEGGGAP